MKSTDANRHAGGAQGPRDIDRPRKLVRLHADQHDKDVHVSQSAPSDDRFGKNRGVGLVHRRRAEIDVRAQYAARLGVLDQGRHAGQRDGMRERNH